MCLILTRLIGCFDLFNLLTGLSDWLCLSGMILLFRPSILTFGGSVNNCEVPRLPYRSLFSRVSQSRLSSSVSAAFFGVVLSSW